MNICTLIRTVKRKVAREWVSANDYHAAYIISREGAPVYHVILNFEDGISSTSTMCYGAHMRDWCQAPHDTVTDVTDPKSKLVWRGDHPRSPTVKPTKVRFFVTTISNPRPTIEVKSISLVSGGQIADTHLSSLPCPKEVFPTRAECAEPDGCTDRVPLAAVRAPLPSRASFDQRPRRWLGFSTVFLFVCITVHDVCVTIC